MDCDSWASDPGLSPRAAEPSCIRFADGRRGAVLFKHDLCRGTKIIVASGTDSGLEAFSHYPADDSFAPSPCRTGADTKYLNERFLSY